MSFGRNPSCCEEVSFVAVGSCQSGNGTSGVLLDSHTPKHHEADRWLTMLTSVDTTLTLLGLYRNFTRQ